jgi:hypothetical protein
MVNPGGDPLDPEHVGSGTGSASEPESGIEAATARAEQLGDRIKDKTADLKRQAQAAVHDVGARARSSADQQKNVAAERVGGVARALRAASDDLDDQGQPMVAGYSRQLAEGLEGMAQSLSRRSVDELVEGVEDFARQRPVAFMGGAMAAGFALARFMKSSAARRAPRTPPRRTPYAAPARAAATSPGAAMPTAATRPATTNQETPDATR